MFRIAPALICIFFLISPSLSAEVAFQAGEEVEINYLGQWRPGRILNVDRRKGLYCQYTFVSMSEKWFAPENVRRLYEKDAIARARLWKDPDGKFSVVAAPLKVTDTMVLLRTVEMKEVKVPIERLCTADQAFLKKLAKFAVTSSAAHRSDVQEFDLSSALEVAIAGSQVASLESDPLRSTMQLAEGGAAFEVGNTFDKIGAIIPLGGNDQWLLASLENSFLSSRDKMPTRLMWISIHQSGMTRMHPLPPAVQLKDYHAASKMALTYDAGTEKPILSIWKSSPGMTQAESKLSWFGSDVAAKSHYGSSDGSWARFASDRIVIFRDAKRRLIAWNLAERKALWTTNQESAQAPTPELTPGRKHLLIPESGHLRVIDPIAGTELATIPCEGEIRSLSIADDGKHVLMLLDSNIVSIDVTGADEPKSVDVGFMNLPSSTTVQWLDQDVVCLSTTGAEMLLFSLNRGIPLWRYEFDSGASLRSAGDDRVRRTVDGYLVYAASAEARIERGVNRGRLQRGIGVGAVKLPGDDAAGYVKYLKRDELIVFDRGDSIRIDINAVQDVETIREALVQQAEQNGWTIDESSKNVLSAKLERGPAQTVQYQVGGDSMPGFGPPAGFGPPPGFGPPRSAGPPAGFGPPSGFGPSRGFGPPAGFGQGPSGIGRSSAPAANIQSASVQPYLSTIQLSIAGQLAWQARSSSGVPPFVRIRQGESLQQKVNESQAPDIGFFDKVNVPESIINPEFRTGLGTSVITNRGLEKKPPSPSE